LPRRPVCISSVAGSRPRARRRRYWIGAALGALALASPLVIAAAPAAAQGIQFSSVSGDGSGDLTVTVTSDYQLTEWTLSLSSGTGTYTLDDFADFTDEDTFAAGQPQTYVLPAADAQSVFGPAGIALPPGDYSVTATAATDSNGDTLPSSQALTGSFAFLAQPTVTLSSPAFNTTAPDQSVTISGQITGCSTVACPVGGWPAGTPVTVTNVTASGQPQWSGQTTGTTGDFSVSDVTGIPGDNYSASVPAISGTSVSATAPSDTQDIPQYAQTSITAKAEPAAYGKQSVTGQLTYEPPSGFTQVGAPAGVQITATAGPHKVSTTTGSNGDFSLALPAITGMTTWLISSEANDLDSTPFLAGTQYSLGATQLWPVKISFSASLDKSGELTVAGCMSPTIRQRPPGDDPRMELYWRSGRSGPWHWLGSSATSSMTAGCAGFGFIASGQPPAPSAYYRAYFPGDGVYAPAASASTGRVWSYPTRFQAFLATPRSVAAGHKVTISGTLQYQAGSKWRAYGNEPVVILFAPTRKATTWFTYGGSVRTNSKGAFSWAFTDVHSDYWKVYYAGNDRHFAVTARPIRVRVHGGTSSKQGLLGQSVSLPSAALSLSGSTWPFVLSADPWLVLMGE
jgi:hypothetical protein